MPGTTKDRKAKPGSRQLQAVVGQRLPLSNEGNELFHSDSGLPDQGSKSSLCKFAVIRNCEPTKGRDRVAKYDVTALLAVDFIAKPLERGDRIATRDPREGAHTATSMTSSWIDGGIGSPRSRRLSR